MIDNPLEEQIRRVEIPDRPDPEHRRRLKAEVLETHAAARQTPSDRGWIPRLLGRFRTRPRDPQGRDTMHRPVAKFAVALAVLAAVNIAGWAWLHHSLTTMPTPRMRVLTFSPDREPTEAERLTLLFDDAVVEPEQVGKRLDRPPFRIEPAPPGNWQWTATNKLEYILARPLPPGHVFNIQPAEDIEVRLGRKLVGPAEFQVQTPALKLSEATLLTADGSDVTFQLEFNQPVDPRDLAAKLDVYVEPDGESLAFQQLTQAPAARHVIRVDQPAGQDLRFRIGGALTGAQGKLPLGEEIRHHLHLPSRLNVTYTNASSYASGIGEIRINLSRPLRNNQPVDQVRIEPTVEDLSVRIYYSTLRLRGKFQPGLRYTVSLPETITGDTGQTLGARRQVTVNMPDRPSRIYLTRNHGVLQPGGNMQLDLKAVNVGSVQVEAWRVFPNNLVAALTDHSRHATSEKVLAEKSFPLDLQRNEIADLAVDLGQMVGRLPGLYRLDIGRDHRRWGHETAVINVTDLAITAKKQSTGYLVWVTSLSGAKPVAGAEVAVRSRTNQVLGRAVTDDAGLAEVRCNHNHPAGPGWVITASKGRDLAYLQPDQTRWMLDDVDTTGRAVPETYDVMLYPERGVYRPGDTIHLTGLIRDAVGQTPPPFPLEITTLRPDGVEAGTVSIVPLADRQGMFHVEVPTAGNCRTGVWRFRVHLPGSDKALGQTHAFVEAFRPVRLAVELQAGKNHVGPGESVELSGSGRYLWGNPAAGLEAKLTTRWQRLRFQSERWPEFVFDAPGTKTLSPDPQETVLDADGAARFEVSAPDQATAGLWQAACTLSVTQEGGRTVSAGATTRLDQSQLHVGLALPDGRTSLPGDEPFDLRWARATWQDTPAGGGQMTLTLYRVEWDYNVRLVEGRRIWQSRQRLVELSSRTLDPPADTSTGRVSLTCQPGHRYQARLVDAATGQSSRIEFYATWGGSGPQVAMDQPTRAEVVLDRTIYHPGQDATVLVRSPIAGQALLTLETDRVLDRRVIEIEKGTATVELPLPADLRGGAFVAVSVIRPVDPATESWKPHRAMGLARVKLAYPARELPLRIEAPGLAQPASTIEVTVETGKPADPARPAMVHLWAVDEGICRVTGFATPDPLAHFLADRRLGVITSDLFFRLLPDHRRAEGMTRIGAGVSDKLNDRQADPLRRNPVPTRRPEPDVVWRDAVPVGPDGTARFELPLPQLYGQMRLMAVAVDGDRYASAEAPVTLRSDLMVEASWPRFAAPGDTFGAPVRLINTTDEAMDVRLNLDLVGPLEIAADRPIEQIALAPGATETIWLDCRAVAPGPVEGILVARQIAETFDALDPPAEGSSIFAMPIRPGHPLHGATRVVTGRVGQEMRLDPSDELIDGTRRRRLRISASPNVQLLPAIEKLLGYPHGCLEQTTSGLYPLLYAPDLIGQLDPDDARLQSVPRMVEAGLARLWSMQTPSGALAYWPGRHEASDWGTAYAAGAILEASKAGYPVDPQFTKRLADYLHRRLNNTNEPLEPNTRALYCRVLARFGRPAHGWMARLAEQSKQLDLAGLAHLAAALFQAGRGDQARKLVSGDLLGGESPISHSGRISTRPAQDGIALAVLLDIQPDHPWVPALVSRLTESRQQGSWGVTISNATALAALSKYQVLQARQADFAGKVRIGSRVEEFSSRQPLSIQIDQTDEPVTIASSGQGRLFVVCLEEGLARPGVVEPHDTGLVVRRRWLDRQGRPIDPDRVLVGDLVFVEVELKRPAGRSVDNIAVIDALPGGFEVENPRLRTAALGEQPAGDTPDRIEFLDDRVVLFATASRKAKTFRYAIRATTAGQFHVPGVQASAMYDPSVASLGADGKVHIRK